MYSTFKWPKFRGAYNNTIQKRGVTTDSQVKALTSDENILSTTYFDGLGRTIQKINWQASPGKLDVVIPSVYDQNGREVAKHLPYESAGANGYFRSNAVRLNSVYSGSEQFVFYNSGKTRVASDPAPFAYTVFEPSPLNRIINQGSFGQPWQANSSTPGPSADHSVKLTYKTNVAREVLQFMYDEVSGQVSLSADNSLKFYPGNQLYKTTTFDENNFEQIEFHDKLGRTVCKKIQYKVLSGSSQYASTYYVYDEIGNLVVILPPEAVRSF